MAYTDPTEMLTLVKSLTGYTDRDPIIQRYLEDSAGTSPAGTKIYRPYMVASIIVKTDRQSQSIQSADGVTFSNSSGEPTQTMNLPALIAGWMDYQLRLDQSLGLTVPDGFAAILSLVDNPVMSIIVG